MARAAHAAQTDKAGRPYAEHLQAVAEGVRARGGDDEQIAAAWLHDAVEDDVLPERDLEEAALTRRTKDIVLAVTKRAGRPPRSTPGASSTPRARCWSRKRTSRTTRTRPAWPYWTTRPALASPGNTPGCGRFSASGEVNISASTHKERISVPFVYLWRQNDPLGPMMRHRPHTVASLVARWIWRGCEGKHPWAGSANRP